MKKLSIVLFTAVFTLTTLAGHPGILAQDTSKTKKSGKNTPSSDKKKTEELKPGTITYPKPLTGKEKEMEERNNEAARLYGEGLKAIQKGDNATAVEYFTKSLEQYRTPVALMKRGFTYIILKKYPEAITDLTEIIATDTSISGAYFGRGLAYYELNKTDQAEKDLTKFVSRDSSNIQAYNYLAAIKFMKKDYPAALKYYSKVISMNNKFPDAYANRGMMRHNLGDLKGAIEDYNEAIRQKPENASAYNNRGAANLTLQRYQDAYNDFDKALKLKEKYPEAWVNRGKARLKLGDEAGACDDFQHAYTMGLTEAADMITRFCSQNK